MGRKAERHRTFLLEHPTCCFCGGNTPAIEEDHIPSRALFDGREWPEGYSFPSCSRCNWTTRNDEQVVAVLARIYPDPTTEAAIRELDRLVRGLHSTLPEIFDELQVPPIEDKTLSGQMLRIDGPLVTRAIRRFGLKLGCALYYKHTTEIVPQTSGVFVQWFTNVNVMRGEVSEALLQGATGVPTLSRNARPLDNQFTYRYGFTADKAAGVFLAGFRKSFLIYCLVHPEPERLSSPPGMEALRPVPR